MQRPYLMIICGVPGAGKSTLARHLSDHWGAVGFASESFASELGAAARNESGDLTPHAIVHAYSAMGAAVKDSLKTSPLVLAVGSFRAQSQRQRLRDIGTEAGAGVTTLRVSCPPEIAASRVRARMLHGENGPNEDAIRRISAELDQAKDIDFIIGNDASIERFCRRADAIMEHLSM